MTLPARLGDATLGVLALAALANLALALMIARGQAGAAVLLLSIGVVVVLAVHNARAVLYTLVFLNAVSTVIFAVVPTPIIGAGGLEIFPEDAGVVLLIGTWIVWEWQQREGILGAALQRLAREPVFWLFLVLFWFVAIAILRAGSGGLNSARPFLYAVVVIAVFRLLTEERHLRTATALLVAGASVTSAYGLVLLASGSSITDADLSTGGTRGVAISASYIVASAFAYVLASRVSAARRFGWAWPVLLLLLGGGILASGARQTWIGVLGVVIVFGLASPVRGLWRMLVAVGAAVLIAVALFTLFPNPKAQQTIENTEARIATSPTADNSAQDRRIKWARAWEQLESEPLLGTGFGATFTYTTNFSTFGSNFVRHVADDPENTHLWIWARLGTLGFIAWIALNLVALVSLLRRFARASTPLLRSIALWGAGTLVIVWAGMAFSPVSAFRSTLFLFWLVLALIPVLKAIEDGAGTGAPSAPPWPPPRGA